MAILGSTDLGDGLLTLQIDHDPTSTSTDARAGSIFIDANNNQWRKLDDGSSTNVRLVDPSIYASLIFAQATIPYVEVNSTDWTTIGAFVYLGSSCFPLTKVKGIVSRSGAVGSSRMRIRDITNNNTIAAKSWSEEAQQIWEDTSISDVPSGEAIFEIQARINDVDDSKTRIWSIMVI